MKKADEVLIAVLGATDALWEPHRKWTAGGVIGERRMFYAQSGVPWATSKAVPGVPDDADRREIRAVLDKLNLSDQVELGNPTGLRTTTIRLTYAGDDRARALAGICYLADSWNLLHTIWNLRADPRGVDANGIAYVPETILAGVEWGQDTDPLAEVQGELAPALCRGLVVSQTSLKGHCWYGLTGAGVAYVEAGAPAQPANLPRESDTALQMYITRLRAARNELVGAKQINVGEIGLMPFPVCPSRRGVVTQEAGA